MGLRHASILKNLLVVFCCLIIFVGCEKQGVENRHNDELGKEGQRLLDSLQYHSENEGSVFKKKELKGFVYIKKGSYIRGLDRDAVSKIFAINNSNSDNSNYAKELIDNYGDKNVRVTVPYDFFISETHISNKEFQEFINETNYVTFVERNKTGYYVTKYKKWIQGQMNSWRETHWENEPDLPVVQISFVDAMAYASWLSGKLKVNIRVPTIEEWELAMREEGNSKKPVLFPWGNNVNELDRKMNCIDISAKEFSWRHNQLDDGYKFVNPVKAFPPTKEGIFDPIGNVWTWVYSTANYVGTINSGDYIAYPKYISVYHNEQIEMKGGCFYSRIAHCNLLSRMSHPATDGSIDVGFRVVIVPERFSGLKKK